MFHNYLLVAFRNLVRHKLYSFINIAGLTVGLTCAIFIILFARDQLSYDRWIPGTDNLYRLEERVSLPGQPPKLSAMTPFLAAQAMQDNIPEVQERTRLMRPATTILVGNRQFPEHVDFVDPNFLQMIRLPLVAGDPARVFAKPASAVLTESAARKYFDDAWPIGKTIVISGKRCDRPENCALKQQALTVTGILRDLPHNTHLLADVMVPTTVLPPIRPNWFWIDAWSYVRLAPGADSQAVTAKFRAVIDRAVDTMPALNIRKRGSEVIAPSLTPFTQVHLAANRSYDMTPPASRTLVYGFSAIGALILLIACFNFTNLATARAMMRAREIALRKVVGAKRRQLAVQFLGEALLTAMIALILALALTEVLLPVFDRVLSLPIAIDYFKDWPLLLAVIGVGALAGLLSGAYPALMLSAFRPALVLRMSGTGGQGAGFTRTALVVLQFAVSIGLGIAAAVIFAQVSFSRTLDLGFRKDAILVMKISDLPPASADSLARALRTGPDIAAVATSDDIPFSGGHDHISGHVPGAASSEELVLVPASPDYIRLYGIHLLAGRLLSEDRPTDGLVPPQVRGGKPFNVLVNASAARRLGYSAQSAIGKAMVLDNLGHNTVTIVGVVADTKQDGPKSPALGTMYMYWPDFPVDTLSVRIRDGHIPEGLSFIARTWHAHAPSAAVRWHFLDEDFSRQFQTDERQGTLFGLFVGIAIFIACLGLFGLAAFSTERRTREIGLRKTFGARSGDIVWMLLRQFSLPVLIANAIAWPVAWYWLQDWLQGFAYRIALSPLYFAGAGAAALVIAWATVFVHALRVAGASPVHALRYE
ncbi:MAG TPA: ABC transporter permease [Rhizomicrobium sp.]|nr:ABC transporter permease [Rhizomicrobium sp.]